MVVDVVEDLDVEGRNRQWSASRVLVRSGDLEGRVNRLSTERNRIDLLFYLISFLFLEYFSPGERDCDGRS